MSELYNKETSIHYSAYRPPLHEIILERAIPDRATLKAGLDIGCGTGCSSRALLNHCGKVHAIDPSSSMLEQAEPHKNITYDTGTGNHLSLPENTIDIVTFAGSLFYAKSDQLIDELLRVCQKDALIVAYDFKIDINEILLQLGVDKNVAETDYDHEINFSDQPSFTEIAVRKEQITLNATTDQLAHILLSSSSVYEKLSTKFHTEEPYNQLVTLLKDNSLTRTLNSKIYYSVYRCLKQLQI